MECREIEWLIDAYLDGTLSKRVAEDLEAHLESCAACRQGYGPMLELLSSPEPVPVPEGLRERIGAAVSEAILAPAPASERPKAIAGPSRRVRRTWLPLTGALAASVAFFMMGWVGSRWWVNPAADPGKPGRGAEPPPVTVVLSPWAMSSLAQALASQTPASPIALVAQAATSELLIESVFRAPSWSPARSTTGPAAPDTETPAEPEVPILPPVIRL